MEIKKILKKKPSELTEQEWRAVGFIDIVSANTDVRLGTKTTDRLENAIDIATGKHSTHRPARLEGVSVGNFFLSIYHEARTAKADITNWAQATEIERLRYINSTGRTEGTTDLLARYGIAKRNGKNLLQQCKAHGEKSESIKRPLATLLGWRALVISLAEALTMPELIQLANLDDVEDVLDEHNANVARESLFLQCGYIDPEEAQEIIAAQTVSLDILQRIPMPSVRAEQAEELQKMTYTALIESDVYFLEWARDLLQ